MIVITGETRTAKQQRIAESLGFKSFDDLAQKMMTSVGYIGICINPGCGYTTECEPDAEENWCNICKTNTVCSLLML